jgi:hypothetical protein
MTSRMGILVNNKKIDFTESDFPMLISGADKTGTSFFSVFLMASLLNKGKKVLFFSAFPMAKEEFRNQIDDEKNAIIIDSGEEKALIDSIKNTSDLPQRVIFIKNIDSYGPGLFNAVKDLKLVIFSGDIDKCRFADDLIKKDWATKIFFSQSKKFPAIELANLPKYSGKIISDKYNGVITLLKK